MKERETLGYFSWKNFKYTEDQDEEIVVCNDLLFILIEKNVRSFFAIEINTDFKKIFQTISDRIKQYMNGKYGSKWTTYIGQGQINYEKELLEAKCHYVEKEKISEFTMPEFVMVKTFIDWLNDRLSISVHETFDGRSGTMEFSHLNLVFPTETSKNIFESHLGGRKSFPKGHCLAHADYPCHDEKNPLTLKFPLLVQADNQMLLGVFPTAYMGRRLCKMLPELVKNLGIEKEGELIQHQNNVSYIIQFTKIIKNKPIDFKLTTPEFLFGFTQLLLFAQFPKRPRSGTLYVKVDNKMQNIFLKSTEKLKRLDSESCEKFKLSIQIDNITIDFKTLKTEPLDISQNKNTFIILNSAYGAFHPGLTFCNNSDEKHVGKISGPQLNFYSLSQAEIYLEVVISMVIEEEKQSQQEANLELCNFKRLQVKLAHKNREHKIEIQDSLEFLNFVKAKQLLKNKQLQVEQTRTRLINLNQQAQALRQRTDAAFLNLVNIWKKHSTIEESKLAENETRPLFKPLKASFNVDSALIG